jgi:L-ascorbate metabolism protein UlaG (beta-lactamase superfamily)
MGRSRPRWVTIARRAILLFALVLFIGCGWLAYRLRDHPSLEPYAGLALDESPRAPGVGLTFLGVSTVLITDGETALLTDGFFTRPGLLRTLVGKIEPDAAVIRRCLERAGITKLAAVFVVHSHYDHAMDAPEVARRTGALVVGSESTANIARGAGLAEDGIRVVRSGEPMSFGRFRVTMILARHFPHGMAMGEIREPLVPPARATDYLDGGSYAVLIEHDDRSLLINASAGYVEGALRPYRADVVLLGIAGLATRDEAYGKAYWKEVVEAVQARRVIPIHWDDFTLPLDEPLRPMPRLLDDFDATMRFVTEAARSARIDLRLVPEWKTVDPFEGTS